MLTTSTRAMPDPGVLSTEMGDGELVLLSMSTSKYLSLNKTGAFIWGLMKQGLTLGEAAEALEARFDVTLEAAEQSVFDLTRQLVAEKLVRLTNG